MQPRNTAEDVAAYIRNHDTLTIVGVDEAGRGTWAGSIFAAAVAVPTSWKPPPDIQDSKKLSSKKNGQALIRAICQRYADHGRVVVGIGCVSPEEIDEIGLDQAQAKAQGEAIRGTFDRLAYKPFVVVDGIQSPSIKRTEVEEIMLVPKADALIPAVSLASIFAKNCQIEAMREADRAFPGYGFAKSCGYGTKIHDEALTRLGPCPIHRRSFGPVAKVIKVIKAQQIQSLLDNVED